MANRDAVQRVPPLPGSSPSGGAGPWRPVPAPLALGAAGSKAAVRKSHWFFRGMFRGASRASEAQRGPSRKSLDARGAHPRAYERSKPGRPAPGSGSRAGTEDI